MSQRRIIIVVIVIALISRVIDNFVFYFAHPIGISSICCQFITVCSTIPIFLNLNFTLLYFKRKSFHLYWKLLNVFIFANALNLIRFYHNYSIFKYYNIHEAICLWILYVILCMLIIIGTSLKSRKYFIH